MNDINITEFKIGTRKSSEYTIKDLIEYFKDKNESAIILKGTKIFKNKSIIIYLIAINNNTKTLEYIFSNNKNVTLTKQNSIRKSKFEFVPWDIVRINNGQLTGSNMNVFNDNEKYSCYERI